MILESTARRWIGQRKPQAATPSPTMAQRKNRTGPFISNIVECNVYSRNSSGTERGHLVRAFQALVSIRADREVHRAESSLGYCLLRRKNEVPTGGLIVTLLVVPSSLIVPLEPDQPAGFATLLFCCKAN